MVETIAHGPIRELRLARPPVNAFDPALMRALREALRDALAGGGEAIVVSGSPGRFSGGLDVPALLTLDRAGIRDAWTTFFGLMRDLAAAPVPVAAAITGHSPAGGTVLVLFADQRVLASVVGERQAARLAVGGLLVGPDEALRIGLVDEVVPVAEVVPRAIAW